MLRQSLTATLLAATLASCVSNEVAEPVAEDIPITYSVLQKSMGTRAVLSGTEYPKDIPFGSFAYYLPVGKTWRDNKADAKIYIDNNKVWFDAGTPGSSFAANSWHSDVVHYWPKSGSLTFFSYSPYDKLHDKISCTPENGLKIDQWTAGMKPGDADATETADLMIAKSENQTANVSSSGTYQAGVPTAFKHILCQIEVRAKLDDADPDADYRVNSITLNNIWSTARFSNERWNNQRNLKNVSHSSGESLNTDGKTSVKVFPAMIMIPQNRLAVTGTDGRAAPSITIDYSYKKQSETSYTSPEGGVTKTFLEIDGLSQSWSQGKKYILTIAFRTKDAFLEFDTSVSEWNAGSGVDIIVGD